MSKVEQTLSLIKPDAVERNLEEEIKQFFIKSGFTIAKQKKVKLLQLMVKKLVIMMDICTLRLVNEKG